MIHNGFQRLHGAKKRHDADAVAVRRFEHATEGPIADRRHRALDSFAPDLITLLVNRWAGWWHNICFVTRIQGHRQPFARFQDAPEEKRHAHPLE